MSTADHVTCCCTETLDDLKAQHAAHWSACRAFRSAHRAYEDAGRDRDELANALAEAIDERDRARDTAARLEAELARGFRIAAPDLTLSRDNDDDPATPDMAVPGPSGALGRPGSALAIRLEAEAAQPYLPAGPFPLPHRDPTPIIEWLASVGLDAQRIPAREPRLVRRDGGAWFLRFYEFALDADGRRILDGDGFAHTPIREVEVATLPPEPWLSDWVAPLDDLDAL